MRATFDDALGSLAVDATPRWRQFEELCRWYLLTRAGVRETGAPRLPMG